MGTIRNPEPVKYFTAITFSPTVSPKEIVARLEAAWGRADIRSEPLEFSFTRYYEKEMGPSLRKFWLGFELLRLPEELVEIKRKTNEMEAAFASSNGRRVNLDPGYIERAKMILASTKNFSHRIYLGKGIYGDLQYRFRQGAFTFLEWTYPDYQSAAAVDFFTALRKKYVQQLED